MLLILLLTSTMASAQTTKQVVVVSGMQQEGNIAQGPNVISVLSGGNSTTLQQTLEQTVDPSTVGAVVSFGVAGGLVAHLPAGAVVVSNEVIDEQGVVYPCDAALSTQVFNLLQQNYMRPHSGPMAGVDTASYYTSTAKAALAAKTGAISDDMESQGGARWAKAHGLPFIVIRTISDPLALSLPPLTTTAVNSNGSYNLGAIFDSLLQDPSQIGALIVTGFDAMGAFSNLQRVRDLVDLGEL